MNVHVLFDQTGMLPDAYGKYCAETDKIGWSCVRSFPFEVTDLPAGTVALAWVFLDWDYIPVCGFPWMHWAAWTSVPPSTVAEGLGFALPDDASRQSTDIHQGWNSAAKDPDRAAKTGYVGPCPPNADHVYTLHVVALDQEPQVAEPFWANELIGACRGHILGEASIPLPSRC